MALKNVSKFFLENSEEERDHANKLIAYHNQRGGTTVYDPIKVNSHMVSVMIILLHVFLSCVYNTKFDFGTGTLS